MRIVVAVVAMLVHGCIGPWSLTYSEKSSDRLLYDCVHEEIVCATISNPDDGFPAIFAAECVARGEDKAGGRTGRLCRCMVDYAAKCRGEGQPK